MGSNGKEIPEYIQQRKQDYVKAKERERLKKDNNS